MGEGRRSRLQLHAAPLVTSCRGSGSCLRGVLCLSFSLSPSQLALPSSRVRQLRWQRGSLARNRTLNRLLPPSSQAAKVNDEGSAKCLTAYATTMTATTTATAVTPGLEERGAARGHRESECIREMQMQQATGGSGARRRRPSVPSCKRIKEREEGGSKS